MSVASVRVVEFGSYALSSVLIGSLAKKWIGAVVTSDAPLIEF